MNKGKDKNKSKNITKDIIKLIRINPHWKRIIISNDKIIKISQINYKDKEIAISFNYKIFHLLMILNKLDQQAFYQKD